MYDRIDDVLSDIVAGKMVIVEDDRDRENEGDLIMAASMARPEDVNFMAACGRGLICVALDGRMAGNFDLQPMVGLNTGRQSTNFTVSVDYRHNTTTGISMSDRSRTIMALSNPLTKPEDFLRPGHVFPVIAAEGGVLKRRGHTEAAVDLMKMAGLKPAGVMCEIINENGEMARSKDLQKFAKKYGLRIISIEALVQRLKP